MLPGFTWPNFSHAFSDFCLYCIIQKSRFIVSCRGRQRVLRLFEFYFIWVFGLNPRPIVFVFSSIEVATVTFDREPVFLRNRYCFDSQSKNSNVTVPIQNKYKLDSWQRFKLLKKKKMLLHSLGLVYKSMRGVMTNSIDRDIMA
jgi:hypothetical protein